MLQVTIHVGGNERWNQPSARAPPWARLAPRPWSDRRHPHPRPRRRPASPGRRAGRGGRPGQRPRRRPRCLQRARAGRSPTPRPLTRPCGRREPSHPAAALRLPGWGSGGGPPPPACWPPGSPEARWCRWGGMPRSQARWDGRAPRLLDQRRRRRHHPAGEFGRLPRSRLTGTTGQPPAAGHGRWRVRDAPSARAASLASSAALPVPARRRRGQGR